MKKRKNKEAVAHVVPDNLIESYVITTARRSIGIYGERFVDVLTQATVQQEKGVFSNGILNVKEESDGSVHITFSISRVMANTMDRNYDDAEEALRCLESVFFEFRTDQIWKSRALITDPMIDKEQHIATFRVPLEIWEALNNRDHGWRKFNPAIAFRTSSEHTYRLYKLIAGQQKPIRMRVDEIKQMLKCGDKYKRLPDFRARVLDACSEDLKRCADWYFTYKMDSSVEAKNAVRRGRPALDIVEFYPKKNFFIERDAVAVTGGNAIDILPARLRQHLNNKLGFTDLEIKNSRVIIAAYEIMKGELLNLLLDNTERIDTAREKKSYTINLIKHYVLDTYGILLGKKNKKADEGSSPVEGSIETLF